MCEEGADASGEMPSSVISNASKIEGAVEHSKHEGSIVAHPIDDAVVLEDQFTQGVVA